MTCVTQLTSSLRSTKLYVCVHVRSRCKLATCGGGHEINTVTKVSRKVELCELASAKKVTSCAQHGLWLECGADIFIICTCMHMHHITRSQVTTTLCTPTNPHTGATHKVELCELASAKKVTSYAYTVWAKHAEWKSPSRTPRPNPSCRGQLWPWVLEHTLMIVHEHGQEHHNCMQMRACE
jgi:hypothetical protein